MSLDNEGTLTLVTWAGAVLSLGFMLVLLTYAAQKMNIVATRTGQTMI